MHRWPRLVSFVCDELLAVAEAMADGSYWEPIDDGTPPDFADSYGGFAGGEGE